MTDPGSVRRVLADLTRSEVDVRTTSALLEAQGTRALSREHPDAHITVGCAVLSYEGQALLVKHRKLGLWLQPGGHVEPSDTTLEETARREVSEESGLEIERLRPVEIDLHEVPCGHAHPSLHHDVRFAALVARDDVVVSEESTAIGWFDLDAMPDPLRPSTARLIRRAAELLLE